MSAEHLRTIATKPRPSLHSEIEADAGIGPTLEGLTWSDPGTDGTSLIFSAALSGAEETALDAVIAAHDPAPPASTNYQLKPHPTDPNGLIVCGPDGQPAEGKVIYVGDAVIGGDSSHDAGKGPIVKAPGGGKKRLKVRDDGVVESEDA